jgi:eukaryotic translation initiation factor 2C
MDSEYDAHEDAGKAHAFHVAQGRFAVVQDEADELPAMNLEREAVAPPPTLRSPSPRLKSPRSPSPSLNPPPSAHGELPDVEEQPRRPDYGRHGRPTTVLSNFCPLVIGDGLNVFQFVVKFFPDLSAASSRRECILHCEPQLASHLAVAKAWAYDGDRILYTLGPLCPGADGGSTEPVETATFTLHAGTPKERCVVLKQTVKHDLSRIRHLTGDHYNPSDSRPLMHILDIVLKHQIGMRCKTIGQAYFDLDDASLKIDLNAHRKQELQHGVCDTELWMGYRQSIVQTDKGPMLQLDLAATTLLAPMNVLEFIALKLNQSNVSKLVLHDADKKLISAQLKGKKVASSHNKRQYKVQGLSKGTPATSTFTDSKGVSQTVEQYFRSEHGIELRFAHLPCLLVGAPKKAVELPLELCNFKSGQAKHDLSSEMQTSVLRAACIAPQLRLDTLQDATGRAAHDPTVNAFGLQLDSAGLQRVGARVLEPMRLQYLDHTGKGCTLDVDSTKGSWAMKMNGVELSMVRPCTPVESWLVVSFSGSSLEGEDITAFVRQLVLLARARGMSLNYPHELLSSSANEGVHGFLSMVAANYKDAGRPLSLIVCVLPDRGNSSYLYPAIKRWAHTAGGIASQCVLVSRVRDRQRFGAAYMSNLLLKLNLKLGGQNVHPHTNGIALVQAAPTIVFGADVYHGPPGSTKPSFAAVVSSMDRMLATYHTTVVAQASRHEVIDQMEVIVAKHLRRFHERNGGCAPQRILFYRDGVGIGQFPMIRAREVRAIRAACASVGGDGYKPAIVFIVVQKRNHCRFFVPRTGAPYENPAPGTVVDRDITTAAHFDFYLCSHSGLKGTARPTHYHVLHDDLALGADELQRFTFDLCHLYARCTRIVSNPAPTYYAHLAADAAHYYYMKEDFSDDAYALERDGVFGEDEARATTFSPVAKHMQDLLYYA